MTKEFKEIKHKGIILDIPKIKKDFIFKDKIIINNLSFSFDNKLKILDNINLGFDKNEKIGIIE